MPAHRATKQSSLRAAWSQGTRNLTVLGPLSGSWVSHEGLRGEAYRQEALGDRVRDRETVSTGKLDTGIHDLISWCRCGGRTASLGTEDCVTWPGSWQQGLSGSSHQSYLVLGGLFLPGQRCSSPGSLFHLRLREAGGRLVIFTQGVQTLLAQEPGHG